MQTSRVCGCSSCSPLCLSVCLSVPLACTADTACLLCISSALSAQHRSEPLAVQQYVHCTVELHATINTRHVR